MKSAILRILGAVLSMGLATGSQSADAAEASIVQTVQGGVTWKQVIAGRCGALDLSKGQFKEKDISSCASKLQDPNKPLSKVEIDAFLNPPDSNDPEAQISIFLKAVVMDIAMQIKTFNDMSETQKEQVPIATNINQTFLEYREGTRDPKVMEDNIRMSLFRSHSERLLKEGKSEADAKAEAAALASAETGELAKRFGTRTSVENLFTDLAARTSRLKLTIYLVGLMEAGQQAASAKALSEGKTPGPAMPREVAIETATTVVDMLAAESCLRGKTLHDFSRFGGASCSDNKYDNWSEVRASHLANSEVKSNFESGWVPGNSVFLLPNGPIVKGNEPSYFDVRKIILDGNVDSLLPLGESWAAAGLTALDLKRRSLDPYVYLWMWGFYDEPVGVDYASRMYLDSHSYAIVDQNVAKKHRHDGQAGSLLTKMGPRLLGSMGSKTNPGAGMHRKGMIVDGKFLIAGGRNFGAEYSKYWRDTDVLIAGPAVAAAAELYVETVMGTGSRGGDKANAFDVDNWSSGDKGGAKNKAFYERIGAKGLDEVLLLDSVPADQAHDNVLGMHIALIEKAAAGSTVLIENAYIILTPPLKEAVVDAMKRGVNFRFHTNSAITTDEPVVTMPVMLSVRELLELNQIPGVKGNVKVKLRQARYMDQDYEQDAEGKKVHNFRASHNITMDDLNKMTAISDPSKTAPSTLHSKYMAVEGADGRGYVLVTSYNLHPRSHRYEDELGVLIRTSEPLRTMKDSDLKRTAYAQVTSWFDALDPLAEAFKSQPSLKNVELAKASSIPILLPLDWTDPRATPAGLVPQNGQWSFINTMVVLVMTLGYEQL